MKRSSSLVLVALTAVHALWGGACTDAQLYIPPELTEHSLDNKVRLTGGFCAEGASELDAFLKIMLIIDRSNSMLVTDPTNQRIAAARDLILRFVEDPVSLKLRAGVEFAVISFFGDVVVHTRDERGLPGFSNNGPQILYSLAQIGQTGSNTGYDKALSQAFLMLDSDMARLGDRARSASRYETIFLSDGMPFPDNCLGEANSPTAAIAAAGRIKALQVLHGVQHTLHTAFASDPRMFTASNAIDNCNDRDPFLTGLGNSVSLGEQTRALLQTMAAEGGGTFTQFNNGDAISFQDFEFTEARRIYALTSFLAVNHSAVTDGEFVLADSDGDGLTDLEEYNIGTSPYLADTDGDGFNDALEWRYRLNGLDPLDPTDANCSFIDRVDTDGDTLLDCEEAFIGTSRRKVDTDADGIPDNVEIQFGTNPNSATPTQDRQADSDADGGSDADEIKWHTNPSVNDVARRSRVAYRYNQRELPITTGQACYEFEVGNISLASTGTPPAWQTPDGTTDPAGWNRIVLYFAQTPYDDPLGDPLYRLACVDARFNEERDLKIPASGRMEIPPKRPSDTYNPSEVLRPHPAVCNASVNQDCGLGTLWCRFLDDGSCQCNRPPNIGEPADGVPVGACPACANGIDDDGDGFTDYPFDPDCFDTIDDDESPSTACFNGLDDDGDGLIDWPFDPGCDSAYDDDETDPPTPPQCADGIDNDGDGAIDFPDDPGCYAASDDLEEQSLHNPLPACSDGQDNDGDGLIDMLDPGCFDPLDIDEDGPAVCFFCEALTDNRPGQCDIGAGYCKPRSGLLPGNLACQSDAECRGAICNTDTGRCEPCLNDADCPSGVCDERRGWCLSAAYTPQMCSTDTECAGNCDEALGYCDVDPYWACRDDVDCAPGHRCSERGFCLERVFATAQCNEDTPCATGTCDLLTGWCLPDQESERCHHDDQCPLGQCRPELYCDQQTFVFPSDFNPEVDCLRAR